MRRLTGTVAIAALVAGSASACKIPASITSTSTASPGSGQPSAAGSAVVGNGTDTLITEPDQGLSPIYSVMSSAQHTLDMTMYELTDSQAEQILEQDAKRGVQVRVILDQNLEKKSNEAAYTALTSAGVHVVWAPKNFTVTHQKTITVDNDVSVIMTLNLTSQYYSTSRDFAVVDKDPADVAAIEQVFNADFTDTSVTPPAADDLVWSPKQSDTDLIALINSATKSLVVENEEMAYTDVVSALVSAAQRGVSVQVVMTNDSSWKANFNKLAAAGVKIATYAASASLYIHAKVILVDYDGSSIGSTTKVFLGSENFSTTSLNRNRELGLITADPAILSSVSATVAKDFAGGTPWTSS